MQNDLNYYIRRAAEERKAGMTAASQKARACHFELAAAYEGRVQDLQAKVRRAAMHIVTAA